MTRYCVGEQKTGHRAWRWRAGNKAVHHHYRQVSAVSAFWQQHPLPDGIPDVGATIGHSVFII